MRQITDQRKRLQADARHSGTDGTGLFAMEIAWPYCTTRSDCLDAFKYHKNSVESFGIRLMNDKSCCE